MKLLINSLILICLCVSTSQASPRQVVLVEDFMQWNGGPDATWNQVFNPLLVQMTRDTVISLSIHGWWPGANNDVFHLWNVQETTQRINYYGVNWVPWVMCDGIVDLRNVNITSLRNGIRQRHALSSPCLIEDLSAVAQGQDSFQVHGVITADAEPFESRLFCVLIQDSATYGIPPGANGETVFVNIFRDAHRNMSTGDSIVINPGPGTEFTCSLHRDPLWPLSNLTLVVFIQDQVSHEILQCNFLPLDATPQGLRVEFPNAGEQLALGTLEIISWTEAEYTGQVSIEIDRHYPIGGWEAIANSTENDGQYEWFVTDPLSDSCRIRICAEQDTFCDVSDGNFSIVSSQGYLSLVKSSQPNTLLTAWNAGVVECQSSVSQWFRFKNFGSESIVVFQPLEPASTEFSRTTPCGAFFALAPNQMSACSVRVTFDAASDGVFNDVLRVQTDAVNGVEGFVEFALNGEQISTPAAPQIVISPAGLDVQLNWSIVDTSECGLSFTDLWYAVFYAPTSGGPFYYHGWTPDTTYTHAGVVNFSPTQFYQVLAVEGPTALASSLVRGEEMERVLGKLEIGKRP